MPNPSPHPVNTHTRSARARTHTDHPPPPPPPLPQLGDVAPPPQLAPVGTIRRVPTRDGGRLQDPRRHPPAVSPASPGSEERASLSSRPAPPPPPTRPHHLILHRTATQWRRPSRPAEDEARKVRGFETQMEKWMGACDCIITKVCTVTMSMQSVSLSISSDLLKKGFYAVQCVSHIEAAWNLAYSIGNSMFSSDYDPKSQHFHGE
ncbi:hypothetical protein U9M48_036725 [Paspalum notatum var. saurae]|uniref:Uncharacterized protein n=1 Tax=Paspalum notatum var. saurae TaxID=547442 RepID=A0AAQ3UEK3_PASNO